MVGEAAVALSKIRFMDPAMMHLERRFLGCQGIRYIRRKLWRSGSWTRFDR